MKRRFVLQVAIVLVISVFTFSTATAQGEADKWHFGNGAAVDFTSGIPVSYTGSAMTTLEGCASIANPAGDLLFYTDGSTVWDITNTPMPNGTGLQGNLSSTQSGVIIPKPGSSTIYYVFAVKNNNGPPGLTYSEVDMTLNGGLGDVTSLKNDSLSWPSTIAEKLTAVKHSNGQDIWVIVHESNTNNFFSFLVTPAGVNNTPVISSIGPMFTGLSFFGYMKASPTGDLVAFVRDDSVHAMNFDNTSGIITGTLADLPVPATSAFLYGLEFSPNGNLLYAAWYNSPSPPGVVLQWDLTSGNQQTIENSMDTVAISGSQMLGALQLGPDNKIYLSMHTTNFLGVIDEPNIAGPGCNYIDSAVTLQNPAQLGLPTFLQSFFGVEFEAQNFCLGDTTFFFPDTNGVDSLIWNFGDPASGVNDTSTALFPFHIYGDTGTYTVQVVAFSDTIVDTATRVITILPIPTLDLGNDTALCSLDTLVLNAFFPGSTYLWNDSSTADTLAIDSTGKYWVTLTNTCGTLSDTIEASFDQTLNFTLGPDSTFCAPNTITLDPQLAAGHNATYLWQDGSTDSTFTAIQSDTVILTVTNGCGSVTDSAIIVILPLPNAQLSNDTIICFNQVIPLTHDNVDSVNYTWSDGTSAPSLNVDTTGTYWLSATNSCGTASDTVTIIFQAPIQTELGPDTNICHLDSIVLNAASPGATYLWQDGFTDSIYTVKETGTYIVTVTEGPCLLVDTIAITSSVTACFDTIDCIVAVPNIFTPNGDGHNDLLLVTTTCQFGGFTISIYNRWGQKVYEAEHENIGWDGTVNGIPVQQGVYYWIIDFKDDVVVDVDRQGKTGSVSVYR